MDDLIFSYADPASPVVKRKIIQMVEVATGQRKLKRIYLDHRANQTAESFWRSAVRRLALDVQFDHRALHRMPKDGPVVVVANHPYGVLDGIVISWLVEQVRSDFLVLTNAVLLRAPEVRDFVLPVDFSETPEALQTNLNSRAAARQHLDASGVVIVFPAGGVSTAPDRLGRRPAVDAPWQPFAAQLIQRSKATVVPIHFKGQNSRLFQIASHLSLTLRLSLIFREVKNRMGTVLPVIIGDPIPFADLDDIKNRQALIDSLMERTYALGARTPADGHIRPKLARRLGDAFSTRMDELRTRSRQQLRRPAWTRKLTKATQPRPR
jgi:putative hemolysin